MNKEQLKEYEPFFGGYFICGEAVNNDGYISYRVKKQSSDGRIKYALLRNYTFECSNAISDASAYPARLRRLVADTDMMIKLQHCAGIVKFYEKAVVPTKTGYEFFILTQDVIPLDKKENLENMSKAEAYAVVSAVCEAVSSFRSLGITHRKICTENVFSDSTGEYLLGDFGLGGNFIVGDDYMTPEEYRVSNDISSADIYQAGMLFYKLLNKNRAPFLPPYPLEITEENRKNAFMRRMNGEITGEFENSSPKEEAIVLKACAYSPDERYRNVSTLKSDIDALIKALMPKAAHDYYAGNTQAPKVIKIEPKQAAEKQITQVNEDVESDNEASAFDDASAENSSKIIKALIISIVVIALLASGIIAYAVINKNKNEEPETTTEAVTTTESTTEETTETTTESTTESTTETTTQPTTESTTQSTTATTESTTHWSFTLPENFTWPIPTVQEEEATKAEIRSIDINPETADTTIYSDGDRIDEIVITFAEHFGDEIRSDADVMICEYRDGRMVRNCYAENECMYEDGEIPRAMCDILVPSSFNFDTENCTYRIMFPEGVIKGSSFTNKEFYLDIEP